MRTLVRGAVAVTACALSCALAGCGALGGTDSGESAPHKGDDVTIGLLLPERDAARYEKYDRPDIEKQVRKLTKGKGTVLYANAGQDAARQRHQFEAMIAKKADVVLVDAVDAKAIAPAVRKAKDAGVRVLAYDRLAEGPVDGYVTFDSELVGEVQGRALREALGPNAKSSKVVMLNGARTDPNAALFKEGALAELGDHVDIVKSYDVEDWKPENARARMKSAINSIGADRIAGVYAANDAMAGAAIAALKEAGRTQLPPVTGQDAELPAVRRIVAGEQYMSVYKPYREEAAGAAQMAVLLAQGRMIEFDGMAQDRSANASEKKIPTLLVQVRPLTRKTIASTVIEDGLYKTDEICVPAYLTACYSIGLKH
ncbi:sugar ABC transporter substrate-binding protein [Streptomyces sp. NPDC058045]|uniref:sugar ABC transporter substrate-binding protein n=1 Tax=Streptomyces sp. NPDC058045 TaxID=3346311 RepID=UPI0036ED9500